VSSPVNRDAARTFVWLNARLIDRHRHAFLFEHGEAEAVLAALRPYQNPDGGFGHALEPDSRGPSSHPGTTETALRVLDEIERFADPMVGRVLGFLTSAATPDGGVPVALPSLRDEPRAPWWSVETDSPVGALLPTAGIAGLLHKHGVDHPWLTAATDFCWRAIAALAETHPYEVEFVLPFLDHVPDRPRAEREAERLGRLVRGQRLLLLDPDAPETVRIPPGYGPGEVHTPLDYAPRPTSLARRWFTDEEIERSLDALEGEQGEDGGWSFRWREWNPATSIEWRGRVTIDALNRLRAYGRFA
jgi:hypothetical protein